MLNSLVADYLVRQQVSTHVTVSVIARLPVPRPPRDSFHASRVIEQVRMLEREPHDEPALARLQAAAARLYGLAGGELQHVLGSFPHLDSAMRGRILEEYEALS
jgi:hypothetical protein